MVAVLLSLMLAMHPFAAHAAEPETVQADAFIIGRLTLTKQTDLDFGQIVQPAQAGTVTLTPAQTAVCTPSANLVRFGTCRAATFWGFGTTNQIVRLRMPTNLTTTLTRVGGTQTMTVTNMLLGDAQGLIYVNGNPSSNGFVRYRITGSTGIFSFRVGGRLNVGANQVPGTYNGTFQLSVEYQ